MPVGDSSKIVFDSLPLIMKWGKKRAPAEVVDLKTTSIHQATLPTTADAPSRLKKTGSSPSKPSHLLNYFLVDALPFSLWSLGIPTQQKGDELLKSSFDLDMFDAAKVTGMFQ